MNRFQAAVNQITWWNSFFFPSQHPDGTFLIWFARHTHTHTKTCQKSVTINFWIHLHISSSFLSLSLCRCEHFIQGLFFVSVTRSTRFIRHFNKTDNMQKHLQHHITPDGWTFFDISKNVLFGHRLHTRSIGRFSLAHRNAAHFFHHNFPWSDFCHSFAVCFRLLIR